jgi:acetyltransferase-like isoleucine patch superfamily enzyme
LKNAKNKLIFGHYGRDVYIHPGGQIVRPQFISIGDNVRIGKNTDIYVHPKRRDLKGFILEISNNVHIGNYNIIAARNSVVLEENALLGPRVIIADHSHHYEDMEVPIKSQPVTEGGRVRIGRDCWIGANVFVLPNVTIGHHAIIGANSVVNGDIPPYSVAVGAPARVIKRYDFNLKQWVRIPQGSRFCSIDQYWQLIR